MPAGTLVAAVQIGTKWRYSFTANGRTATITSRQQLTVYGQAVDGRSRGARLVNNNGEELAVSLAQST